MPNDALTSVKHREAVRESQWIAVVYREERPHGGVKSGTDYAGPHWWVGPLQAWNEKFVFIYIFLLFIFPSNY